MSYSPDAEEFLLAQFSGTPARIRAPLLEHKGWLLYSFTTAATSPGRTGYAALRLPGAVISEDFDLSKDIPAAVCFLSLEHTRGGGRRLESIPADTQTLFSNLISLTNS